eukprot:Skav209374  [mRNA]  locus=scaffold64:70992:72131:+ [translate_table: standard]
MHADYDLLHRLHAVLSHDHEIRKVKSHQKLEEVTEPRARYHFWGKFEADKAAVAANRELLPEIAQQLQSPDPLPRYPSWGKFEADKAAVAANRELLPEIAQQLQSHADSYHLGHKDIRRLHDYLLVLHRARSKCVQLPQQTAQPGIDLVQRAKQWRPSDIWTPPQQLREDALPLSPWGLQLMWVVQQWLLSCEWPTSEQASPIDTPVGLSWAEVAVALALQYGAWLPVRRPASCGRTFLFQPGDSQQARQLGSSLGEQARIANILVTQFRSLVDKDIIPDARGGKIRSLLLFGFGETIGGLRLRPYYPHQISVCNVIQAHVQSNSASLQGLPDLEKFQLDQEQEFSIWPECQRIFVEPWVAQPRNFLEAQKLMKSLRTS